MTTVSNRRMRNIIGILAIALMVVFYILEFVGVLSFLEWIILVLVVFLVANIALRRARKREQ